MSTPGLIIGNVWHCCTHKHGAQVTVFNVNLKLLRCFFPEVILDEVGMCSCWRLQLLQHFILISCQFTICIFFVCKGISSSMNFDEEEDDEDEISSSSSQLNSNTRPGSATSKKSCKVKFILQHTLMLSAWCVFILPWTSGYYKWMTCRNKCRFTFFLSAVLYLKLYKGFMAIENCGLMWYK